MILKKHNAWPLNFVGVISRLFCFLILNSCGINPTATIAAYGDSVTWGYGGLPGGWVDALSRRSGYQISNLAIPGEKARGGAERIDEALSVVPGAKVFMLLHGGNDWIGNFRGDGCSSECEPSAKEESYVAVGVQLDKIRSHAAGQGKRVVFATYWPSSPEACSYYTPERFALYQAHLARLNQEAIKIAQKFGDEIVRLDDLTELPKDSKNWFDCLHPSRQGYEKIAERWEQDSGKWEP